MRTLFTPLAFIHNGLKQRAKNRRRDFLPTKRADIKQFIPHIAVKRRQRQTLFKQIAIDIFKLIEIGIERFLALITRCVEHLKQLAQTWPDIRAIFLGAITDIILKAAERIKDSSIIGE